MGKGRLTCLSPKCRAIIPLSKEYFPVPQVKPFGYDKAPNEGTVKFWAKFGENFPIFPKIGGRGEESNHGKRIPQTYSVVSKEITVTSGDNSWFSKGQSFMTSHLVQESVER